LSRAEPPVVTMIEEGEEGEDMEMLMLDDEE
jgi:hypothetical protein